MRDCLIRSEGVGHRKDCALCILQGLFHRLGKRRTDQNRRRSFLERVRRKLRTVEVLSTQGDEEISCLDFPRIRRDLGDGIIAAQLPAVHLGIGRCQHLIPCQFHITAP